MKTIQISIFQYQKLFFQNDKVVAMKFKAAQTGEMTILPEHSPLISDLKDTAMQITLSSGANKTFQIKKGILHFRDNVASVMTDQISEKK